MPRRQPYIAFLLTVLMVLGACGSGSPPPAVPAELELDWPDASPLLHEEDALTQDASAALTQDAGAAPLPSQSFAPK